LVSGARNFATGMKNRRQKPTQVFWCRFLAPVSGACVIDISWEDIVRQSCAMMPKWPDGQCLAIFWVLHFQRAAHSTFQTCILNSYWGHTMCRSMVDIHSAAAEIRRGKQKEERKKRYKNIMSASATQGGHKETDEYKKSEKK